MKSPLYKILTWVVLPVIIVFLVYEIVAGIMEPVNFNKEKDYREKIAIERLKGIRTIQTAFKTETGHYTASIDSLKAFYNEGKMTIDMQVGSADDSVAVANTKALKKKFPKITNEELLKRAIDGESLVFTIKNQINVKDTLFNVPGFCIDSLFMIPFCGEPVTVQAVIKQVSGVNVPLFEASMTYKQLLTGLDNQLRINLDADREAQGRYKGLMVGSIYAPNNNAGNWE